jgi:hypothetical protein
MANDSITDFNCITIHELPCWIKVLSAEDPKPSSLDMLADLTLIDDLLTIMKSQALLKKKRGLKDQLERRIAYDLGFINSGR